jgi:hypothetical protein
MIRRLALLTLVTAAACGDSDNGGNGGIDAATSLTADQRACALFRDGPAMSRAATDGPEGAPSVTAGDYRYDLTMPEGEFILGAFVKFTASAERTYHVYFTEDFPLALQENGGPTAATISGSETSVAACSDVKRKYTVPFTPGTYELLMGPLEVSSVRLVIVAE